MEEKKRSFFKKNFPILAILFILGIIFLFLSEYDSNKTSIRMNFDPDRYTADLEQRLSGMLEKMDGVEDVKVMITLESSSAYQFIRRESTGISNDSYVSSLLSSEHSDGEQEPIRVEVVAPKIKGVSVVCKGAKNIQIRERIINLIAGTLDLTKNKIYVTE